MPERTCGTRNRCPSTQSCELRARCNMSSDVRHPRARAKCARDGQYVQIPPPTVRHIILSRLRLPCCGGCVLSACLLCDFWRCHVCFGLAARLACGPAAARPLPPASLAAPSTAAGHPPAVAARRRLGAQLAGAPACARRLRRATLTPCTCGVSGGGALAAAAPRRAAGSVLAWRCRGGGATPQRRRRLGCHSRA